MDKNINSVFESTDYKKFSFLKGNRSIDQVNLNNLENSMKRKHLETPLLVNTEFQIIDGQHRFEVCKKLNLPIYYIQKEGYGTIETKLLNTASKKWSLADYLVGYCDLGFVKYLELNDFISQTGLGLAEARLFIDLGNSTRKLTLDFRTGNLDIKNIKRSYELFDNYKGYKEVKPYGRLTFVRSLIGILKNENYDHRTMQKKLEIKGYSLGNRTLQSEYQKDIEDIYNYNSRNNVRLY